jgi:hypothetical protein
LAYVQAKSEVRTKLEDIRVVCNYPDIFFEVMRLTPDPEIEFSIDLMPGTQTYSQGTLPHGPDRIEGG